MVNSIQGEKISSTSKPSVAVKLHVDPENGAVYEKIQNKLCIPIPTFAVFRDIDEVFCHGAKTLTSCSISFISMLSTIP